MSFTYNLSLTTYNYFKMRILERYIFSELIKNSVIAMIIMTFVLLAGNMVKLADLIINKGVSAGYVLKILLYLIPSLLIYTIPMSLLAGSRAE